MGFRPSFISLPRLLFGAALVILGFFLASSTQAHADDLGLVKTIDSIVDTTTEVSTAPDSPAPTAKILDEPVKAVAEVTKKVEAVEPVVESVAKPVVEAVAKPVVKPVVESVAKPVVEIVAKTTTAVVTKTTTAVVRAVEPLAPVDVVVEPVKDIVVTPVENLVVKPVKSVVPVADSAVEVVLPGPTADVENVVGRNTPTDSVKVIVPATATATPAVEQVPAQRAPAADRDVASGAGTTARAAFVSPFVSAEATQAVASMTGSGDVPNHPGAPVPAPLAPVGTALSGAGSTGNSPSVGGGDVATTSVVPALPDSLSDAVLSRASRPHPGPSLNPGSRPD